MPKVVLISQVQDPVKWEAGFRTHGDIFKTYSLRAPITYSVTGNEVAVCMEPESLDTFRQDLQSQATQSAMAADGVKRESLKMFVLDKEMKV